MFGDWTKSRGAAWTTLVGATCIAIAITGVPAPVLADPPPPPPTQISFGVQPGDGTPGGNLATQPVVYLKDAGDDPVDGVSVALTLKIVKPLDQPSPPALSCTTNPVTSANSGQGTFAGCKVTRGGLYKLTATDSAHGLTVDSNEFFVSGAAQLAFTAQPQSSPAGAVWSAQPQVTVQDAHGTTVSTTHEIGLVAQPPGSSSAGWSPLPCTTNPVAATAGVAQFAGCKIDAAGTGYTLYALDKVDNLIFASNTFNVTTGTVSSIAFTRQPAGAPGGQNLLSQPIVTAKDAGGNPVTSFTGAVSLAITSGTGTSGAALGCTSNSVNAVAGVATFAGCDVDKAGSGYTLTATASSISKTATSTSFAITSGTATGASFFHQPGDAHGGAAFGTQPAVRLTDAGGNPVDGTVSLAIKPTTGTSGALLACTANPLATTNGVATFAGCAIDKNGTSYQLVATSGGLTVDSAAFDVTSGTAAALQFASTPPSGTGGTTFGTQPAVHVLDGGGNSASGSVTLSIASGTGTPGAGLDCTAGTVASSGGTATFAGCRIDKAGAGYRLKATLAGNSAITVTSAPFDVAVGTPARLTFRGQPGGGTGGAAWTGQPVVAIEDAGGNIVSAASATIHLAVTNGTGDGTLDCQDDAVPTQLGVAHFKACSIDATASAYTLTATATVGGNALSKVSDEFAVTVGDPASLRFTTQPDGAVAGGAFATQPVVAVLDAGGNVVTSASSTISLSIADGTGSSGAALACAAIAAASGVASFSGCSIDRAGGGYALTATGGGLTRESRPFSVLVPPPAPLGLAPVGVPAAQTYGGRAYADNPTSTEDDVNSATGSLAFTSTDLRVSGVGMPLVFERTYNSADATGGMFGRGWTSVLDISVKVVPGQTMTVRGEDGQQLVWTWNTVTNGWVAPPGAHVQLTCGAKTCKLIRDDGVRWDVNLTANGTRQITDYLAPDLLGLKFAWQANKVVITVGGGTNPTIVNAAISAAGRVTSLTTPTRSVSYAYSAGGLLTGVNDVRGKTWGYYYDGGNRLATLTDPLGRSRLVVTYAGSGRVSALRAPNDFRRIDDTFAWDAGTQTATRSALTNVLGSEQREDYVDTYLGNVLVSQTLPTGGVTRYSYDSKVHLIESQNALGWVTTYAYDNAGNLVQESSPTSSTQARTVRMGYDGQHRITSQTDPNGNTTTYVYNGPWLGAVKPPATGNTQWLRFDYNSLGELTRTVGPQNQRVFTYDAHGNQTSAKIQTFAAAALNGNGTAFTYDEAGDRTSMKDALNRTTTWAYDSAGHLLSTIPPLGNATLYSYDDSGDLSGSTDPATHTTLWSWNEPTRTRTMTVDGTPRTVQTYDPSGNLLSDLAPTTGRGNTYAYDVAGRNVRLTDAAGVRTSYAFDLVDNLVAADDSVGRTLAQQFDALNRPIRKVANGRVTKLGYDAAGNVVSSTDASGHTTTFGYDVVNAVTSARTPAGTTTYGYDTAGDLTSVTDPGGHATAYLYDAVGRRTKATTGGAATSYTYDNVDNVKTTTDPDGRVTTYTLDALNRPTTTKYSWAGHADVTVGQTYDVLGRRHTMTDSVGTHTYTYDPNGNLTQVATGGDVFSYDYTSTPGKVVETYPDGTPVTYGLDDAQNLMSVQSGTQGSAGYVGVSYLRNALRDTAGIAFSNGVLETRQTDVAGDVLSQTLTVGGQLAATDEFSYDRGGNPLSQVSTVGGNVTTNRYGYDGNGRLNAFSTSSLAGGTAWPDVSNLDTSNNAAPSSPTTTVAPAFAPLATPAPPAGPGPSQSLTYDGDGNRLSNTTGAGTTGYGYNAKDQLVTRNGADGAATYAYDSSGNLTSRAGSGGTTTYGYDSASRLVRVTLPGGAVVTYTYDGDGNRVSKTAGGQTTQYLWDPANVLPQLALERKASDHSLIRRYVYGDGPVAMQVPDGAGVATYFFHLDPQGSITELTTADGQLAAAYHYDGWGNVTVDGDGHGNPLLFQAEYRDPDTGLYYMRARNYDATTGRFTQKDPKAAPVGAPVMTPYHFAYDHPTSLGDPTGETVNENDVFWSHNNLEANVASDVNLGVGAIKLGIGAYKGVLALGEMLSPKAITATESLGSSVGAEARAVGAGAGEVGSEAGALGKLGGEGAAGAEALEGSGKALKAVGTGLAIAGLALQTYITVEDCIHNTALVCAADVTGLAISLAFTVGCEFVSAGAASVVCAIVGGALAVAIPMLITAYGPQMVAGVMTAYDAVADLAVAGANIVADAVLADVAVLTDVAQTFAGSVVTGYNTAVSALSSGYQTAIGTLVDAGYSALQLAETLATTFTQGVDDAIAALAGFGYDVADVAVAVKDWFGKTAGETAALLKDTYSWTVDQVSAGLTEAYGLAADGLAAALDFAAYAVDEIASGLKSALDATTAELAEILDGLGYGIDQVAAALQDVYDLADQALADLFHDLDSALGYTLDQITGTLQTIYNDADAAAAAALQFASYAAGVIADALKDVYDDVATEVAAILDDLTFTVNEIANAMVDAFALADEVTAQILDNLGKTATQVAAALVDAYEDAVQTITDVLNEVGYGVHEATNALISTFGALADDAADFLDAAGYALLDVANALQDEFLQSASDAIKILDSVTTAAIGAIATAIGAAFALIPDEVAQAFKDAVNYTIDTIAGLLQDTYGYAAQAVADLFTGMGYALDAIKGVLESIYGLADDIIGGLLQLAGWAADLISDLGGAFASFGQDIADAASDAWDTVTSWF